MTSISENASCLAIVLTLQSFFIHWLNMHTWNSNYSDFFFCILVCGHWFRECCGPKQWCNNHFLKGDQKWWALFSFNLFFYEFSVFVSLYIKRSFLCKENYANLVNANWACDICIIQVDHLKVKQHVKVIWLAISKLYINLDCYFRSQAWPCTILWGINVGQWRLRSHWWSIGRLKIIWLGSGSWLSKSVLSCEHGFICTFSHPCL